MHCLVEYVEDKILHIVQTKTLREIEKDKLYWAPYKKMGFYEAVLIYYDDDRHRLEVRKRNLQKLQGSSSHESHISMNNDARCSSSVEGESVQKATKKPTHKPHSCYFCKRILYQLPRHWFNVHYKEVYVREIMALHPNNPLRLKRINELRKKGDFEYNKQAYNEKKIVIRKSAVESRKYLPCSTCLGYFSKDNLRHHRKKCSPHKGDRTMQGCSRKLTFYIHDRASQTLRNHIAPAMYQDEISNHFLFDEIIILYGNYLCIKYTDSHLKNYIRAQLRLLGRLMMQIKIFDPSITCFKDLVHLSHTDTIRKSIDSVAGLDENTGIYEHPTNARTLSTEFKKIIEVVQSECDKKEDDHLMKLSKALFRRYKLELAPYINRICKLSENKSKRKKKNILPENDEIEKYLEYLLEKITFHCTNLKIKYCFNDWSKLSQCVLVALVVFNRKRPGETQRIELEDFHKRESVSGKDMELLSEEEKLQADKYVRVAFRGKLGNSTALLIDKHKILPAIKIMIKYRLKSSIHPANRFLFACPSSKDKNKTYDAYRCHRHLLEESGVSLSSLTFTNLRKQFATQVARAAPSHEEELRVSNYMSHDYNIHKRIYDQSASVIDITKISKHLEQSAKGKQKYMGKGEEKENNSYRPNHRSVKQKCTNENKIQRSKTNAYLPCSATEEEDVEQEKVREKET